MPSSIVAALGVVGGVFGATGAAAAVVGGAVTGAVLGGVVSAVKGGNILKGAMTGGLLGGAVGGLGALAAPEALATGTEVTAMTAPGIANEAAGSLAGTEFAADAAAADSALAGAYQTDVGATLASNSAGGAGAAAKSGGLLGGLLNNDMSKAMAVSAGLQGVSGMAQGYMAGKSAEDQRDWAAQQKVVTPNGQALPTTPNFTKADDQAISYRNYFKDISIPRITQPTTAGAKV